MKRSAASPVESEKSKDPRVSESPPIVAFRPPSQVQSEIRKEQRLRSLEMASYAEVTKSGRTPPRQRRDTESIPIPEEDHLLKTDGALRNNFTVEILKKNGEDFRGQITNRDAAKLIYLRALRLPKEDLVSVVPAYRGVPSVLFKLKNIINVDKVFEGKARFSFTRAVPVEGGTREDTYDCNIRGVREVGQPQAQRYTYLKIEGMDYQVDIETIRKWLLMFGNIMSEITEDVEKVDISSDEDEGDNFMQDSELSFATGIYSVKMLLHRKIPQFLPIGGKKIKIYHRGIDKLCSKCYQAGHNRIQCPNDRREWLSYIDRGMQRANLDNSYYGGWVERVADWRLKCPGEHEANVREIQEEKQHQARPERVGAGREEGTPSTNATEELTEIMATTELGTNMPGQYNTGAAEVTVTQILEAAKPTEAVLPATLPETTGENVQGINRVQDLTVGELEEMLKKKRMAEKKNQKKADNENPLKEKKPVRNRSASLRRNSENK